MSYEVQEVAGVGGRLARGRAMATGAARRQGEREGGEGGGKARHLQVCASLPVPVASSCFSICDAATGLASSFSLRDATASMERTG